MDAEGQTVWSYAAPKGTEIHTIQPIGRSHVVFVQNGKPAKAVVMEIPMLRIVREFELPTSEKGSVHGQFRNARLSNGDWACSLIVSQDEVACDAVAMDIIIGEWPEFGSLNYCDEYLREAASIPNAPSGTVYKQDGKPLDRPLGLFEHCSDAKVSSEDPATFSRKYKKIDLKYKKL